MYTGALLTLSVTDDGRGGAQPTTGGGLAGLRDRVEALDGTLHQSHRPEPLLSIELDEVRTRPSAHPGGALLPPYP